MEQTLIDEIKKLHLEGKSRRQISDMLGVPASTVYSKIQELKHTNDYEDGKPRITVVEDPEFMVFIDGRKLENLALSIMSSIVIMQPHALDRRSFFSHLASVAYLQGRSASEVDSVVLNLFHIFKIDGHVNFLELIRAIDFFNMAMLVRFNYMADPYKGSYKKLAVKVASKIGS
jgi:hypothetical protein